MQTIQDDNRAYLDRLDEKPSQQPRLHLLPTRVIKKRRVTSTTDPDCGAMNHSHKQALWQSRRRIIQNKNFV